MATTEAYGNTATIGTTQYSLTNNSTTIGAVAVAGVYQALLDLNALAAGDEFEFVVMEKVLSGGTQRTVERWSFNGAQGKPHFVSPAMALLHGWEMTVKKISGTDRSISWSIRKVA